MTPLDEDLRILDRGVSAYLDAYRELSEIWKTLETKAQVTITVSGIFLAAVFAFCHDAGLVVYAKIFIAITFISLLAALFVAFRILQVEDFEVPTDGAAVIKRSRELTNPGVAREPIGTRYSKLVELVSEDSERVLAAMDKVNTSKQHRLGWAYNFLMVAALSATIAGLMQLFIH